jgi:hypothetical protein
MDIDNAVIKNLKRIHFSVVPVSNSNITGSQSVYRDGRNPILYPPKWG